MICVIPPLTFEHLMSSFVFGRHRILPDILAANIDRDFSDVHLHLFSFGPSLTERRWTLSFITTGQTRLFFCFVSFPTFATIFFGFFFALISFLSLVAIFFFCVCVSCWFYFVVGPMILYCRLVCKKIPSMYNLRLRCISQLLLLFFVAPLSLREKTEKPPVASWWMNRHGVANKELCDVRWWSRDVYKARPIYTHTHRPSIHGGEGVYLYKNIWKKSPLKKKKYFYINMSGLSWISLFYLLKRW